MKKTLTIAIALYIVIFSSFCFWKYSDFRYNARDLAIYNQVVWQLTSQKPKVKSQKFIDRFESSIQGHNYLGDHVEPALLLLVPLYKLFPDPRTLLVMQTLALALAAIPLFLITKNIVQLHSGLACPVVNDSSTTGDPESRNKKTTQQSRFLFTFLDSRFHGNDGLKNWLPALIGILWLLHPAVQNANLFEFHSLAFAPLFLFFLFWAYLKLHPPTPPLVRGGEREYGRTAVRPYIYFFLWLLLALSVREDVALIILALGILMLWKHRRQRTLRIFALATILTSGAWFYVAQRIIAQFSPSQGYQYRIYYQWLTQFDSFTAVGSGILTHLFTLANLEMLVGLLLPLLFLPLLKPKWLLLALPPLTAIMLSQAGGSALIWQTHYGLLLLPGIFLSFIATFKISRKQKIKKLILFDQTVVTLSVMAAAASAMLAFGPLIPAVQALGANDQKTDEQKLAALIPASASVAATDRFLAPLSSRSTLTLLPLMLLGTQQYGAAPYPSPAPDYILLDENDIWADLVQAHTLQWTHPFAAQMLPRFRTLLNETHYEKVARRENAILLQRTTKETNIPLLSFEEREMKGVHGWLTLDRLGSVQLMTD